MADRVTFKASARGSTEGAVTGTYYHFQPGQVIEAPKGEFDHVSDRLMTRKGSYQTRPMRPESTTESEPDEDVVYDAPFERGESRGAGYYWVEQAGEVVTDSSGNRVHIGRGKEEVDEKLASVSTKQELLDIAHVED